MSAKQNQRVSAESQDTPGQSSELTVLVTVAWHPHPPSVLKDLKNLPHLIWFRTGTHLAGLFWVADVSVTTGD